MPIQTSPNTPRLRPSLSSPPITCDLIRPLDDGSHRTVPEKHPGTGFIEDVAVQNGGIYTGEFEDGKRHGRGITQYPNGATHEGNYFRDLKHGFGAEVREACGCAASTLHPLSLVWAGEIARVLPTHRVRAAAHLADLFTKTRLVCFLFCLRVSYAISPLFIRHFRRETDMRGSTSTIDCMAPVPTAGMTGASTRACGVKAASTGTVSPFVFSPRVFMFVHVYRVISDRVKMQPGLQGHLRRNAK
jgi:hypothetical protein